MDKQFVDPGNDLGPALWSQALSGHAEADVTVLLEPSFQFNVHLSVLTARAPALARLVLQNDKNQSIKTLDLRGEERPLVLCMLEYIYVNEYTALTERDAQNLHWANDCRLIAGFHNRIYLLAASYGLPKLQELAWNECQLFQRLQQDRPGALEKVRIFTGPLQPLLQQGEGQGGSSKGKGRENNNSQPMLIEG